MEAVAAVCAIIVTLVLIVVVIVVVRWRSRQKQDEVRVEGRGTGAPPNTVRQWTKYAVMLPVAQGQGAKYEIRPHDPGVDYPLPVLEISAYAPHGAGILQPPAGVLNEFDLNRWRAPQLEGYHCIVRQVR